MLWKRIRGGELSRTRVSASVGVGLFIGCLPLYGLHFVLCAALCLPLRLDLLIAYIAANISNPVVAPFLVSLEIQVGSWLLTGHGVQFDLERAKTTGVTGFFAQALLGAVFVGGVLALAGALLAWVVSGKRAPSSPLAEAIERTVRRYRSAQPADRIYAAIKLRTDPLTKQLAELTLPRGRVLDIGCGRGQFGLLLVELNRAESVWGCDWDTRKIDTARDAALGSAEFEVRDLREPPARSADVVLLFDVLHYLTIPEQNALLENLARRLSPGGYLLVREVDNRSGARSGWTRGFERLATRIGYNRARSLHFRSSAELVAALERAGLTCSLAGNGDGVPLANVLIVAQAPAPSRDDALPSKLSV